MTENTTANSGLAKVAVQCSADTFVVNQSLVPRINILGENRQLRQAEKPLAVTPRTALLQRAVVKYLQQNHKL